MFAPKTQIGPFSTWFPVLGVIALHEALFGRANVSDKKTVFWKKKLAPPFITAVLFINGRLKGHNIAEAR